MKQLASRAVRLLKARANAGNWRELQDNFRQADPSACYLLHVGFFLAVFFETEDEDMFLRNVS
jgi:hypothetical protein